MTTTVQWAEISAKSAITWVIIGEFEILAKFKLLNVILVQSVDCNLYIVRYYYIAVH